jgi:hypothetical protein
MRKNPEDYVIGPDATIEDVNLDEEEIYVDGERFTEAKARQLAEESERLAAETRKARMADPSRDSRTKHSSSTG